MLVAMHQPGFKKKLKTKLPQYKDNNQKTDAIMWGEKQTISHSSSLAQGRSLRIYLRGYRELLLEFFLKISTKI